MGPMSVVVVEVGLQDCSQVATAKDEDPVGALAANRTDSAFGDGVGAGRADRRANDLYLFRGEDGIETGDELGVAIADQETQPIDPIARSMSRLWACWVTHDPVGWAVMPARCTVREPSSMKDRT